MPAWGGLGLCIGPLRTGKTRTLIHSCLPIVNNEWRSKKGPVFIVSSANHSVSKFVMSAATIMGEAIAGCHVIMQHLHTENTEYSIFEQDLPEKPDTISKEKERREIIQMKKGWELAGMQNAIFENYQWATNTVHQGVNDCQMRYIDLSVSCCMIDVLKTLNLDDSEDAEPTDSGDMPQGDNTETSHASDDSGADVNTKKWMWQLHQLKEWISDEPHAVGKEDLATYWSLQGELFRHCIKHANIMACTLAGFSTEAIQQCPVPLTIVDEAGQAREADMLGVLARPRWLGSLGGRPEATGADRWAEYGHHSNALVTDKMFTTDDAAHFNSTWTSVPCRHASCSAPQEHQTGYHSAANHSTLAYGCPGRPFIA